MEEHHVIGNLKIKEDLIVKKIVVVVPKKEWGIDVVPPIYKKVEYCIDGILVIDGELQIRSDDAVTIRDSVIEVNEITINPNDTGVNYIKGNVLVENNVTIVKGIVKVNGNIILAKPAIQ